MNKNNNFVKIKCLMEYASVDANICIMLYRLIAASTSQDEKLEIFKFFLKKFEGNEF